jgi:uncharacterized protein YgiM (DUF1202 family)
MNPNPAIVGHAVRPTPRRRPVLALALTLGILMSLVAAVAPTTAAPNSAAYRSCDPCLVITTDNVNLRTGPGRSYEVIRVIPHNTEVLAYSGVTNGYSEVINGDVTGWVYRDYLRSPDEPNFIGLAATARNLNLREGPGRTYDVLAQMPANSIVKITDQLVDGYRLIAYNGDLGWAYDDYLVGGTDAVATRRLAIRAEPRSTSAYRGAVPAWESVTAFTAGDNGYVLVMYQGNVGWVKGRYLGK